MLDDDLSLYEENEIILNDDAELIEEGELDNQLDIIDEGLEENLEEISDIFDTGSSDNDSLQNSYIDDSGENRELYSEVFNSQDNMEANINNVESLAEGQSETNSEIDYSDTLAIIQQNEKIGFDNLTLIGTVQTGLIAFGIGSIIIYCYIGRIK